MKNEVCVIIPYYHNELTALEQISLRQCFKILRKYPIILLIPESMCEKDLPEEDDFTYLKVPDLWLDSVQSYNDMLLSKDFYEIFYEYEYILIYQLDAFVFEDKLEEFCNYQFDYIGAPWIFGEIIYTDKPKGLLQVGNGGLSLRKVKSFITELEKRNRIKFSVNEDLFWSSCASDSFRTAPIDIALQFAFERDVKECFKRNNFKLPFGCHAWEKHDALFWKPHFDKEGYKFNIEVGGNLDQNRRYYLKTVKCILYDYMMNYLSVKNNSKIYIWGAGKCGRECGLLLKNIGIEEFRYVDNDGEKRGQYLSNSLIESPEALKEIEKESGIVIITVKRYKKEILQLLQEEGYVYGTNILFYEEVRSALWNMIESLRNKEKM